VAAWYLSLAITWAIYALQGSLADFPLEQDLAEERQAEQNREDKR
jgi:hypothetical protein